MSDANSKNNTYTHKSMIFMMAELSLSQIMSLPIMKMFLQ